MFPLKDENPTTRFPWVTILLIAANIGIYFLIQPVEADAGVEFTFETAAIPEELTSGEPLSTAEYCSVLRSDSEALQSSDTAESTCASPSDTDARFPDKNVYFALVYSMFLHGGLIHLFGNMLFLWVFGNNIEDHLGPISYAVFYVLAGVVATAAHVAADLDSNVPVIGASGAIAGVMGAYAVWFPWARIRTIVLFLFLNVRSWIVLAFWFLSQFFISPDEGIAYLAHVGGFVFGAAIAMLARSNENFRDRLWRHKYQTQRAGAKWDSRYGGREELQAEELPYWYTKPDL